MPALLWWSRWNCSQRPRFDTALAALLAFLAASALLSAFSASLARAEAAGPAAEAGTDGPFFQDHKVALGWQTNFQEPFTGVSFKRAINLHSAVQLTSQLRIDRQAYRIGLGVRYLRDLGKKFFVHRYYGAGIGFLTSFWKAYNPTDPDATHNVAAAQAFIGIEVPWTFWQLVSALSSSAELSVGVQYDTMGGQNPQYEGGLSSQYGGAFGLHYWF